MSIDKKAYGEIYSRVLADAENTAADLDVADRAVTDALSTRDALRDQLAALTVTKTNLERFVDAGDVELALRAQADSRVIITLVGKGPA